MPYEYTPPKYAQVIAELQRRIENGEYPPGSLMPSEHQLSGEFGIARPTVVRALRVLRQEGWIETQQGKGSFVRGRPALAEVTAARRGARPNWIGTSPGSLASWCPSAWPCHPPRIAALLGLPEGREVLCRRRLIRQDGDPSEVVTWWFPRDLAEGTSLADESPLHGGVRAHLARRKGVRVDHVVEQVTARHPAPHEVKLLGITRAAPVLALYVSARDASGSALFALDVAMPGTLHELEDAYPVG